MFWLKWKKCLKGIARKEFLLTPGKNLENPA